MYQWWLFSSLTVCFKLVCCRKKADRNVGKKPLVNDTLHLIFGYRFQKVNTQNLKYQCVTHFFVQNNIFLWNFFPCNEAREIKPPRNPEKCTLGRINSHSFNNILSRFSGTRKSNKNFILTITVHHLIYNLHSFPYLYWHYKLVLRLSVFLVFCKWLFHWTSLPNPGLYHV